MTHARYDAVAAWYAERAASGTWLDAAVRKHIAWLVPDVPDGAVLDLCCGEGWMTRELTSRGFVVSGVDLSGALLAIARERDPGGTYVQDDAQSLAEFADAAFGGAICVMALMDVAAVCGAVRRVVREGGWFAVVITHPAFEAPHAGWNEAGERTIGRYLTEGAWRSGAPAGVPHSRTVWWR